ncbi:hypothetical protein [Bifidobacterium callitrichidarum]|uniref:Uncharacterized protein n=1 Tax=Bifidobacterium callitrichidarum TaxID=2052941 RepID=A0A2U2N926_9BIFI|nr:hypothetical protein [Bifidobacterium callitrichidarum]PWG65618.1 hypothetical protein DF196_06710 [Bifidobacterium callitrichidarum]
MTDAADMHESVGFAFSRTYHYNVFGADERIECVLWRFLPRKRKWRPIERHVYATGLTGLGRLLVERKERDWALRYRASRYAWLDGD